MIFFKTIQSFLLPGTFSPCFVLAGVIFLFFKKRRCGRNLVLFGLLCCSFFSSAPVSDFLLSPLEQGYQRIDRDDLDKSDVVVLLLGGEEGSDLRAAEALRISALKNQKTEIIVSGTDPLNPSGEKGREVRRFLTETGVPEGNIVLDSDSRNTFENARNVEGLVGRDPFFLVTSSYHMRRSVEAFRSLGANPVPAPTDFRAGEGYDVLDLIPNSGSLRNSDLAFHEYFGILYYRWKYY